jgi:hypothetical protein
VEAFPGDANMRWREEVLLTAIPGVYPGQDVFQIGWWWFVVCRNPMRRCQQFHTVWRLEALNQLADSFKPRRRFRIMS